MTILIINPIVRSIAAYFISLADPRRPSLDVVYSRRRGSHVRREGSALPQVTASRSPKRCGTHAHAYFHALALVVAEIQAERSWEAKPGSIFAESILAEYGQHLALAYMPIPAVVLMRPSLTLTTYACRGMYMVYLEWSCQRAWVRALRFRCENVATSLRFCCDNVAKL